MQELLQEFLLSAESLLTSTKIKQTITPMDTLTVVGIVSGILASLDILCRAGKSIYLHFKKNQLPASNFKKEAGARPTISSLKKDSLPQYIDSALKKIHFLINVDTGSVALLKKSY